MGTINLATTDWRRVAREIERRLVHHMSMLEEWNALPAAKRDAMVKHAANNVAAALPSLLLPEGE